VPEPGDGVFHDPPTREHTEGVGTLLLQCIAPPGSASGPGRRARPGEPHAAHARGHAGTGR
jgi:hypothetical protein